VSVEDEMGLILLVLLLALIFGGLGFALHWLWIIAVVLFSRSRARVEATTRSCPGVINIGSGTSGP